MRGITLLGTDTGVGKTTVACGLLRLAARRGIALTPFKPVETGCSSEPSDADRLLEAAGQPDLSPSWIRSSAFSPPLAPSIAARLAGVAIDPARLSADAARLSSGGRPLLIESAGGLLAPYGPALSSLELVDLFDTSILLVAANRLGTINHTRLALAQIQRQRAALAGLILVDTAPEPGPDAPYNRSELEALTGLRALGVLPFCAPATHDAVADALERHVDLSPVFAALA
jgi:dethiobiotin synthetase